jgi:hypothetical protein
MHIKGNGKKEKDVGEENKSGRMDLFMKVIG